KQLLQDYDLKGEAERLGVMQSLSAAVRETGLEPLCRIVRFEKSAAMAKRCAVIIMEINPNLLPNRDWNASAKAIEKSLAPSTRPAARCLLAYVLLRSDPEAGLPKWNQFVADETATLEKGNGDSAPDIVLALQRRQVEALLKLDRTDEALDVMRKMIALDQAD